MRLWKPQIEIADAIGDDTVERITILKSARAGHRSSTRANHPRAMPRLRHPVAGVTDPDGARMELLQMPGDPTAPIGEPVP